MRIIIATVLGHLGPGTPHVVPALKKALDDETPEIRHWAVLLLLHIDHPTGVRLGVPVLGRLLNEPDFDPSTIYNLLTDLGPEATDAIPALIDVLKNKSPHAEQAAYTLGCIGPAARAAVPTLLDALDSGNERAQVEAVMALGKIGPDARDALPALRDRLAQSKDDNAYRSR